MVQRGPAACDPADIQEVVLDGTDLGVAEVIAVARLRRPVSIAPKARHRVDCCRRMIDLLLERREKIYGLTTGFGKLRDITIQGKDVQKLQINLIRSHACGVGEPFDEDVVRAALLLRANTLCRGHSGIRNETLDAVVQLLNDGVYPYVPIQGSVGASGDLAPLSHMALVVMGDPGGRFFPRGSRVGTEIVKGARAEDFVACGALSWDEAAIETGRTFEPVTLQAKEGLALNNGTQFMSALGCLLLYDAGIMMEWAELGVAMCLEAQRGVRHAFHPDLHRVRDLSYQGDTAARVLEHVHGSEILDVLINTAYLQRSRHHLREAQHHLEVAAAETPEGSEHLLSSRELTFRAQIPIYEGVLDSLRREATGLLSFLDQPSFPRTPLMRESAVRFLGTLEMAVPSAPPVQDDYSLRCSPQVLACCHRALAHAREVLEAATSTASRSASCSITWRWRSTRSGTSPSAGSPTWWTPPSATGSRPS